MTTRARATSKPRRAPSTEAPDLEPTREIDLGGLNINVGYQIRRVNARSITLWEELISGRGVAWGQYSILKFLSKNPGLVQKELAAIAGVDQTTLVPVIKHLEKAGLVDRQRGAKDGRNVHIWATAQGEKLLTRVDSLIQVHDRELTLNLTLEERETLLTLLAKISGLPTGPAGDAPA
ncbi:MarR family winged helix-turn-helix transcriptional regulator [Caulobacter soli]|uniref:MarR family winged helix-turn-helix transcriptional regulator n=1 Tax=Caulobacter soli TaxID=2708539 RepID=UPI0013E9A27F|nr:MarR family winged helix-turn-helix transcriptional regulator [Caulobacter soli]